MGLPRGTVTFVFTDLEGSTRRWELDPAAMAGALARHDGIVREAVGAHGGTVFSTMGDGMAAVFPSARDAVRAVLAAQQGLAAEDWGRSRTADGTVAMPREYVIILGRRKTR